MDIEMGPLLALDPACEQKSVNARLPLMVIAADREWVLVLIELEVRASVGRIVILKIIP